MTTKTSLCTFSESKPKIMTKNFSLPSYRTNNVIIIIVIVIIVF